ncbi:SpoIID/LytB domain-containing protein [Candidatus Falkowbacteria bacterium]|nr:SpoIID/LytB domain-containing protein [Candidatus Falkowbacteria bacterium]
MKSKKAMLAQSTKSFVASLVTALVVVILVSRVLALIDHRLSNGSFEGFSILTAPSVQVASAHHLGGYAVVAKSTPQDMYYIKPAPYERYYVGDVASFTKALPKILTGVSNKEFKSWKGKAPQKMAGKFIIVVDDAGKLYYVHPKTREMFYANGAQDAIVILNRYKTTLADDEITLVKIASGFQKTEIKNQPITSQPITSQPDISQLKLLDWCKVKGYKIATMSDSEKLKECEKIESKYFTVNKWDQKLINEWKVSQGRKVASASALPTPQDFVSNEQFPPKADQPMAETTSPINGTTEPVIRVGIFYSVSPQRVTSASPYKIVDANGNELLNMPSGGMVSVDYDEYAKSYYYGAGDYVTTKASTFIRLVPTSSTTPFEIVSYEQRPAWNLKLNDNKYLGTLEVRYNSSKDRTWIINELPLETYLKGIAEVTNSSPMEYHKAMVIAQRTYATHHINTATKHADEYFILDATFDQVYKGYGTQQRMSNVVAAVEATKGMVVTYSGKVAITPFYSWSDGRTRSMKEVWGVDKPWLQSVKEPAGYDKTTLYGHGVGLSARGAYILVNDHGYTYDQVLKYYYTGIEITSNYNK